MPHGTYASISVITEVLVSPGEREAGGCSKGSQHLSHPCPKAGLHHMGYGIVVGRRERFIHPPQDNTEVCKTTQHPHVPTPVLPGHCAWSKFWQPMKMGLREAVREWIGREGSRSKCHSSGSITCRNWAAVSGFRWAGYSSSNTNSLPSLSALSPSVLPSLASSILEILVCRWEIAAGDCKLDPFLDPFPLLCQLWTLL